MKKEIISSVVRMALALAGIAFIVLSIILDQTSPYLMIGLGFTALANIICWCEKGLKKGRKNGSAEDRSIS